MEKFPLLKHDGKEDLWWARVARMPTGGSTFLD